MTTKIAVPSKGRLHEPTLDLLDKAGIGIRREDRNSREYLVNTNMPGVQVRFLNAADIPNKLRDRRVDIGITGWDLVVEKGVSASVERLRLSFGACCVIAATAIDRLQKDVESSGKIRVATEFPAITEEYFKSRGKSAEITILHGAVEGEIATGDADMVVTIRDTGATLIKNKLAERAVLLESSAVIIARNDRVAELDDLIKRIYRADSAMSPRTEGEKKEAAD